MNYIDEIINKSVNKKIISVDIFDTLLLRDGQSEETRFFQSALALKKMCPHINSNANTIFKARYLAHHTLYKLYAENVITEPSIDSILSYQLDLLNDKQVTLEQLLEIELNVELNSLSVNRSLLEVLNELSENTQIVLLSDMYLSSDIIKKIINFKKITLNFDLYVSTELKKSKHRGNAFPWLINQYNTSYENVLHIGDNYNSDVTIPNSLSIVTVFTPRHNIFYMKESFLKTISNLILMKQIYKH